MQRFALGAELAECSFTIKFGENRSCGKKCGSCSVISSCFDNNDNRYIPDFCHLYLAFDMSLFDFLGPPCLKVPEIHNLKFDGNDRKLLKLVSSFLM